MATRKSFEQKNNYIHPTRKKIIDTVFGREDNTQKVHGYEAEAETKREVGEFGLTRRGKSGSKKKDIKYQYPKWMMLERI